MKKAIIIISVIAALVALAYFKKTGKEQAVEVKIERVQAENIKRSILASGTLVYKEQVQLRSEVIGQVKEMLIEEGDNVNKGQVLMRLEPRTFKADVEQQEAYVRLQTIAIERQQKQLENLSSQWQRKHDLFKLGIIDQDAYELIDNQLLTKKTDEDACVYLGDIKDDYPELHSAYREFFDYCFEFVGFKQQLSN